MHIACLTHIIISVVYLMIIVENYMTWEFIMIQLQKHIRLNKFCKYCI
jgi:hypothetical protein